MVIKIMKICCALLFVVCGSLVISVVVFFNNKDIHLVFSAPGVEANQAQLQWNNALNLEQSHNACGPYSTMAYAFVNSGLIMNPEKINQQIGGRHGDGLTYPWGITTYLNQQGSEAHSFYLGLLNKEQKINWIKNKIHQGRPVIALIGTAEWGHYVTILGYRDQVFFKYDSYLSGDLNALEPGNATDYQDKIITEIEAMKFRGISPNLVISY
jgi:hypothetical protein